MSFSTTESTSAYSGLTLPSSPITPYHPSPAVIDPARLSWARTPSTRLGIGTFGAVYSGKYAGADVAIKCVCGGFGPEDDPWAESGYDPAKDETDGKGWNVDSAGSGAQGEIQALWREIRRYERLKHPCIVQFYGVALDSVGCREKEGKGMVVVTELMHGGSLLRSLDAVRSGCGAVEGISIVRIGCMVAGGLRYLHQAGFTSGDLKSLNVMLSESVDGSTGILAKRARVKLADFGLSGSLRALGRVTLGGTTGTEVVGSAPYLAPEVWKGDGVGELKVALAADIYALGVILYEIMTLRRPWKNTSMPDIYELVVNQDKRPEWPRVGDEDYNPNMSTSMKELVERCWKTDPLERPTTSEVYEQLMAIKDKMEKEKGGNNDRTTQGPPGLGHAYGPRPMSRKSSESIAEQVPLEDVLDDDDKENAEGQGALMQGATYPTPPKFLSFPHSQSENESDKTGDSTAEDTFSSASSADYYSAAISLYKKPSKGTEVRDGDETSTQTTLTHAEIEHELSTWIDADLNNIDHKTVLGAPKRSRSPEPAPTKSREEDGRDKQKDDDAQQSGEESTGRQHSGSLSKERSEDLEGGDSGPPTLSQFSMRRHGRSTVLEYNQLRRRRSCRLDSAIQAASSGFETWRDHARAIERAAEQKDHSLVLGILRHHGTDPMVARAGLIALVSLLKSESRQYDFCEEGGIEALLTAASRHSSKDAELAKAFCDAITTLAAPYDPRICHMMRALGVASEVMSCMDLQSSDTRVLESACTALYTIIGGTELSRCAVASLGGPVKVFRALSRNLSSWQDIPLTQAALRFFRQFAWQNSANAMQLMNLSVIDAVNRTAEVFTGSPDLDEDVIAVLEAMAYFPEGKKVIVHSGGFNSISSIMSRVGKHYTLAERCCVLVVSIAGWRDQPVADAILRSSVVEGIVTITRRAILLADASGGRLGFHAAQALLYILCFGELTRARVLHSSGLIVLLELLRCRTCDAYCSARTVAAIAAMMVDEEARKELKAYNGVKLLLEVKARYPRSEKTREWVDLALKRLKYVDSGEGGGRRMGLGRMLFPWKKNRRNDEA